MYIESKLKPLYANLKRINIGDYLFSRDFKLFTIENNIDEVWKSCKKVVVNKKTAIILGFHNTEEEEEAFLYLMSLWYTQNFDSFGIFITSVLLNYAKWYPTKLDLSPVHHNLDHLGLPDEILSKFTKEWRKIRDSKPERIEEKTIDTKSVPKFKADSNKVFIVHGHDDKARLELSKILKNDLDLEPIVLKEEPNVSIETIISKFERLAKECSAAIILFTPDDNTGEKLRVRQNVVLELGYFLGKFHDQENRRIAIIKTGDIEIPSDISGVLYLEYFKSMKEIFYDLKKQFETWGYK